MFAVVFFFCRYQVLEIIQYILDKETKGSLMPSAINTYIPTELIIRAPQAGQYTPVHHLITCTKFKWELLIVLLKGGAKTVTTKQYALLHIMV